MELTERKAKLYQAIVKHILQHSHRRHSSPKASKLEETDYEAILAEIGKVALAGLLKGDLVFGFGQLSEKVRGEEGVIVGLFQFSEYGPSLEPMEMVSFIHKSIQEYLAAWYLIYSCDAKGNLGEIGHYAATLENCEALENVFQFVCGLSDEGAVKILQHLKTVRISDPTLDLSKTILDAETKTDVPVCDVTRRHQRFSNLAYDSFREVQSKAQLLSHFLDCIGEVILVTRNRPLSELMPNVDVLTKLADDCVFIFITEALFFLPPLLLSKAECVEDTAVFYKLLDFLSCLQTLPRVTDSSDILTVEDFMRTLNLVTLSCCLFGFILCFRNGQFQFYITKLLLKCDDHARLFTGSTTISVPSNVARLCSEQSCLKFLSTLHCRDLSSQTMKSIGAVIRNCKNLSMIKVEDDYDSICHLLEHVRNPSKCSLKVDVHLTSAGTVQLVSLLPRFNSVITLCLHLADCCAAAQDTLVTSITHKTLEKLILLGINLTPAGAETLGRALPEMSSLQKLELTGIDGSILQAEEMEALFGGFNKTVPLSKLTFSCFNVRGCLSPLIKSLPFFPSLRELKLERLNTSEHDQCSLLKSFRFLTKLKLHLHEKTNLDSFHYRASMDEKVLKLGVIHLTPALAAVLGRFLPELSSLRVLGSIGFYRSILQAEEMEALCAEFNNTISLYELIFTGFNMRGRLAPLFKSFHFFPNLRKLNLENLNMDEHDLRGLLESFQFIPNLQELSLSDNPIGHAVTSIVPHVINLRKLRYLCIHNSSHSEEDLNYFRNTAQQALPKLEISTEM